MTENKQMDALNPRPELMTITEAGTALRISRWSIYRLINSNRLRTVRIDRRRLVAPADLAALIEELREEGDSAPSPYADAPAAQPEPNRRLS